MSTKNRRITIYLYIEDSLRSLIPNYNQRNSLIQSLLSAISDIHKAPEENHRVKITLSKLIGEELVHYPIIDLEITKDRQKRTSLLTKLLSGEI